MAFSENCNPSRRTCTWRWALDLNFKRLFVYTRQCLVLYCRRPRSIKQDDNFELTIFKGEPDLFFEPWLQWVKSFVQTLESNTHIFSILKMNPSLSQLQPHQSVENRTDRGATPNLWLWRDFTRWFVEKFLLSHSGFNRLLRFVSGSHRCFVSCD